MTSGIFHNAGIDDILIQRESRQRQQPDPKHIDELADSIRRLGLIHPPVVTRDYVLVSGECRMMACRQLGWLNVPVQFTDELEPAQLKAIELEENVKRRDLDWKDRVRAVQEYHALMVATKTEGKWSHDDTAREIGFAQSHVTYMLSVAEELATGNERVMKATKLSTAAGIVRRARERKDEQVLKNLKESIIGHAENPPETILHTDFTEWVHSHVAPRFNFIHCDFPYGIEADTFNQGAAPSHGGYEDTREAWERLMLALRIATERVCTHSAHLMFWFAMRKRDTRLYEYTARWLEDMGWDINPLPLIWMKSDGVGIIPDPERGPRQIYETCLFGSRGDRKIVRAVANAYAAPTVRDKHMSEKPEPMLRHFFSMFVDENTVMLDPTCGSGSALRAAESLNAKFCLGLEINEEFAGLAREALERSRRLKRATETVS
jgi:ParB/RepB/Spo0J family partition protein